MLRPNQQHTGFSMTKKKMKSYRRIRGKLKTTWRVEKDWRTATDSLPKYVLNQDQTCRLAASHQYKCHQLLRSTSQPTTQIANIRLSKQRLADTTAIEVPWKKKTTKQNKGLGRCGCASAGLCKKRQYDPSHWSRPIPDLINKISVGAITNTVWTLTRH